MLANFFGKSKPVNFILIIVLFLGYYILDNFMYRFVTINLQLFMLMPLYLAMFFLYNFIISKNKLTKDDSYAFLLFVIGLGCLPQLNVAYETVFEYIVLFLFLRRIYSLRTYKLVYEKLFDSGLWLGVLFLLSPAYLLYILLLLVAVALFVKIVYRTILIPLLGFLIPMFMFFTYHFYVGSIDEFYQLFEFTFSLDFAVYSASFYAIPIVIFGVITFTAVLLRSGRIFSVSNKFKRSWSLLLLHLLVALCSLFLVDKKEGTELIGILIPSTILIANWLQSVEKKLIVNIVLLTFLVISFAIHFIA